MSFDANAFAAELRRALGSEPIDTEADSLTPTPAPAPELTALEVKCSDGPFRWVLTPQRGPDQLIVSVTLEPVARVVLE